MFRSFWKDRKLVFLLVILYVLAGSMLLIWRYYDAELQRIEDQTNDLKTSIE